MKKSSVEKGTLYQLRNLLNRTGVPMDPADNMKGAEDFLLVVLHSHIVAAANIILSDEDHPTDITLVSRSIVAKFVRISCHQLCHLDQLRQLIAFVCMLWRF